MMLFVRDVNFIQMCLFGEETSPPVTVGIIQSLHNVFT